MLEVGLLQGPGLGVMHVQVWEARGLGLAQSPSLLLSLLCPTTVFLQVFLTATHSHSSPFDVLEGYVCPVLFGATWGGDHHHDNHGAAHGSGLGVQHVGLAAKAKEELSEGSRKKKTKKAD